jgi:hypothetical protein
MTIESFVPRLDILPAPQRRLWEELTSVPGEFALWAYWNSKVGRYPAPPPPKRTLS